MTLFPQVGARFDGSRPVRWCQTKDGPGTVGAVLFRGLADWIGVD